MNSYVSPNIVEYGNSTKLIQGDCGWGTENTWLDKTGYYEWSVLGCSFWTQKCNWDNICANSKPDSGNCTYVDQQCL